MMPIVLVPAPRVAPLFVAALMLISACSGSGGSQVFPPIAGDPTTPTTPTTPSQSFTDLSQLAQNLYSEAFSTPVTPDASMPTTGTASYHGAASYVARADIPSSVTSKTLVDYVVANPRTVSNIDMTANFANSTVNGRLSNFVDRFTGTWQGSLDMTNGTIANHGFAADVSGSIGPAGEQVPTSGRFSGSFGGNSAEFIGGAGTIDGGTNAPANDMLGVIMAKQ